MTLRTRNSSLVIIAVTMQRLLEDTVRYWPKEQALVLEALRRSKTDLNGVSNSELRDYVSELSENQFQGMLNNVKGQYHELLFVNAENIDGDNISAQVFEATNHPGADVEFVMDGEVIREVQLKAAASTSTIREHFEKYPDIEVLATSEVAAKMDGVESSGFSNVEITKQAREGLENLDGEGLVSEVADGVVTGGLMSAALLAGEIIKNKGQGSEKANTLMKDVAVGGVASLVLNMIL